MFSSKVLLNKYYKIDVKGINFLADWRNDKRSARHKRGVGAQESSCLVRLSVNKSLFFN